MRRPPSTCQLLLLSALAAAAPAQDPQGQSLVERAAGAENAGRFGAAGDLYVELLEREPLRAEWLVAAGRCLGRAGRFNDAIDLMSRRRGDFPGVLSVPAMLARTLLLKVETEAGVMHPELLYADAIALCEEILAADPGHQEALLIRAQARYGSGDADAAAAAAQEAARRLPQHAGAQILVGRISFDRFRRDRQLLAQLEEQPGRGDPAARAALEAAIEVDRKAAIAAFERAAELDPDRAFARVALGDLSAWDKAADAALGHWTRALAIDPEARIDHGWIEANTTWQQRRDAFARAAELYRGRAGADPRKAATLDWYRARALYDGGQWQAARALFEQIVRDNPENTNALYYAGVAAWRLGDEDGAEALLAGYARASAVGFADVLRQLSPEWRGELAQMVRYLGDRAYRADRKDNSRDLNHVIAALQDSADAWNNYAFLCRETARYGEALAGYMHAIEREPDSPQLWNDAGVVLQYHLEGDDHRARARQMYERALDLAAKVLADGGATDLQRKRAEKARSDAQLNLKALDG